MANFTPGPWERRVNEDNSVIRIEAPVAEDYRRVIGYVSPHTLKSMVAGVTGRDDGTNFANARLIAAAPNMHAALQYARNLIGPDEIIDAALSLALGEKQGE